LSTQGTTSVNFGTGKTDASVAVSSVSAWTLAEAWIWPVASANNLADNHVWENLIVNVQGVVVGSSFNIVVKCTQGTANGIYNVAWVVN
jgi:hypothetical protein